MSGAAISHRGRLVFVFDADEDITWIHDEQNKAIENGTSDNLIYVALEGTLDTTLIPKNFLIKNYNASLRNHFLWEGYFTEAEQNKYLFTLIDNFIDTGKQILIEEYEFVDDEPFYDYSGGRE